MFESLYYKLVYYKFIYLSISYFSLNVNKIFSIFNKKKKRDYSLFLKVNVLNFSKPA